MISLRALLVLLAICLPGTGATQEGIWLTPQELMALPTSGPAWEGLRERAQDPLGQPSLANQDDPSNVTVLAQALVAVRTGDEITRARVRRACLDIQGTERGARVLSVARELIAYVIAADLVGLEPKQEADFRLWLSTLEEQRFQGRTLRSTHEDRPNNWGTHAGATRIAIAAYLGDREELQAAAEVFRGWLGEPDGWQRFRFGKPWWQPPGPRRFGVNPVRATLEGFSIDGVLPDDQRRGGPFRWPPPRENYVYEALQGAVGQAMLLHRQGFDAWTWGDRALLRAFQWLHEHAAYPAEGDDTWMPHVINAIYGTRFPAPVPSRPGKGLGFTDWTHVNGYGKAPESPNVEGTN